METRLTPPQAKGHHSVVRVANAWYVACESRELGTKKPIASTVLGVPLALFRDGEGVAHAVLDRCPHRNVPLSAGRVCNGVLECSYHGWQFRGDGTNAKIPGLAKDSPASKARNVLGFPTRERDGLIWIWASGESEPVGEPYVFPHAEDREYTTVRRSLDANASMYAVIENTLDVPHTAFLHRGLFRGGGKTSELEAIIRHIDGGVEAEYVGEAAPSGLVGKVLARGEGTLQHFDRFLLPCIAQVEYRLGKSHMLVTSAHTPISDFHTRVYVLVTFKLPLPHWLVRPFLTPVSEHIWKQDARILSMQRETTERFGGEQFVNTPIDVLGPQILRKLKEAERGDVISTEPEVRVKLSV
ncbi:MAG: Rieske 2Fe-2S domain-containing protein [Myxococcaceae bacterium]